MAGISVRDNLFTKNKILVNNLYPAKKLPLSSKSIRHLVSLVMKGEDCILSNLNVNFVTNTEIKKINRKYLKHDYFTDIITFPYNVNKRSIEGEIFISLDTVKENGEFYGSGYKRELERVIIHGCLHLAGYNDKTKKQQELIRKKENYYLLADS